MLKAVKECLKNWLVTHERLYWYIVVGIAVFLFGLITAIGCGRMVDANAAIGGVAPELYEIDFGDDLEFVKEQIEKYENFVVCKDTPNNEYWYLFWAQDDVMEEVGCNVKPFHLGYHFVGNFCIHVDIDTNKMTYYDVQSVYLISAFLHTVDGGTLDNYIGSNADFVYGDDMSDDVKNIIVNTGLTYPTFDAQPEYMYSPTAPYIGFDSLTIKNKLGTADIDYGLLGGTDLAQNTVNLDWLYEQGMDMSFWQYNGHVCNLIGFSPEGMQLHMAFTVELPTNEFITAYINKYNNGAKIDYREAMKNVIDSVADWLINDGPTKTYDIKYVFEPVVNADGTFSVSLTFQEIYDLLCYFNEDFLKLYGASTNENMSPYIRAILMSHLHIEQTNSLLYVPLNGTMWYGNPIINFYSRGIVNKAVTAKVEVDIRTATEEEISEAMKKAIEKGYDEALKDANDALGDAENELEGIYGVDGAFGELEGSDLWSGFKGLVTGFTGSIPAIQSLSLLVGAVFAFLPMQVSGIMSFTLLALCIIGIYKAIRG